MTKPILRTPCRLCARLRRLLAPRPAVAPRPPLTVGRRNLIRTVLNTKRS